MSEKVFLLKFGRCSWSRCLFCGYGAVPGKRPETEDLKKEFDSFFKTLDPGEDHIKVFGSGSFLDEKQIPEDARSYFIERCKEAGIKKLTVESRPEHIKPDALDDFAGLGLEVAIGLEVADDRMLAKIDKGFRLRDFERAAGLLHSKEVKVRAYLLVNPPYAEDIQKSLDSSVKYALKHSDSVVLINLLPHYAARLMAMWVQGEWSFLSRQEFSKAVEKWRGDPRIEFDEETFRFTPRFPENLKEDLSGVGERFLTHPHFDVWNDYLVRWYETPSGKDSVLFLPCSYKKPYSESSTHKAIIGRLKESGVRGKVHEVMLSNAGVIPREFENFYPFNAYDWDEKKETEEIKRRYVDVTQRRIEKYLRAHHYGCVMCYLKYDSESYQALCGACAKLGLEMRNLLRETTYAKVKGEKRPLQTPEALDDLSEGLKQ